MYMINISRPCITGPPVAVMSVMWFSQYEFDVLIGADGKRNTLAGRIKGVYKGSCKKKLFFT